jgi:hypothetical protein
MDTTELQTGAPMEDNLEKDESPFLMTSEWFASFNPKHKRLATELMVDLLAIDQPKMSQACYRIREYWKHRRCIKKPTSWEEFLDYRIVHAGCRCVYCISLFRPIHQLKPELVAPLA